MSPFSKSGQNGLETLQFVVPDREHVHLCQFVEILYFLNLVVVERQIGDFREFFKARNLSDTVEGEIKPLEIDQMVQVLDAFDQVIVQLELLKTNQAIQVLYFENVLVR